MFHEIWTNLEKNVFFLSGSTFRILYVGSVQRGQLYRDQVGLRDNKHSRIQAKKQKKKKLRRNKISFLFDKTRFNSLPN